jgi:glycosyltransferase involved in cell wall biosynthesis
MKILHVINDLNAGGAERLLVDTLPIYNQYENVKADLLLLSDKKNVFESQIKKAGINIFVCKNKNIKTIFNIFNIRRFILHGQYDIVHVHLFPSNYWVSLARKLIFNKNLILIASEHNTYNRRRNYKIFHILDKIIYKEFDYIISVSNKTELNLQNWLNITQKEKTSFKVVENAVNIKKFHDALPYNKEELVKHQSDNLKLICMVGSFGAQKDQDTLIKSMVSLNENVHLLLVGQGDRLKDMKKLVSKLQMTNRVHFLGVRTDVERILKTSDIIALSSHWEGFGLVAVEGMAAGKPVLASNVDGLREVVEGAGLLFEKGNSSEFSTMVKQLLNDPILYEEISYKCLEKSKLYDIKVMVNKTFQIYKSLLDKHGFS